MEETKPLLTIGEKKKFVESFLSQAKHFDPNCMMWGQDNGGLYLKLYTANHSFLIALGDGESDYLGCTCSTTHPWPGEQHTRGCDLTDGKFGAETLTKILLDILTTDLRTPGVEVLDVVGVDKNQILVQPEDPGVDAGFVVSYLDNVYIVVRDGDDMTVYDIAVYEDGSRIYRPFHSGMDITKLTNDKHTYALGYNMWDRYDNHKIFDAVRRYVDDEA